MGFLSRHSARYRDPIPVPPTQGTDRIARFGPASASIAVAQRTFGSVHVTCSVQARDSRWGKHKQQDTAILYFMINASQPPEYKMHHFEIDMRFSEHVDALSGVSAQQQDPGLYLLDPPSPKWVGGSPTKVQRTKQINVQPQIEAMGAGGSLGGYSRSEEADVSRSWIFRSSWIADCNGLYKAANWIWEANVDNPQVEDRGVLYTALALRHPAQPFNIVSTVNGKLMKDSSLMRFKLSPRSNSEPSCTTRLLPLSSDEDLEAEILKLEEHIVLLNTRPAASKSSSPDEVSDTDNLDRSSVSINVAERANMKKTWPCTAPLGAPPARHCL